MYFPIMSICGRKQPRQFQHKNLRGLRNADSFYGLHTIKYGPHSGTANRPVINYSAHTVCNMGHHCRSNLRFQLRPLFRPQFKSDIHLHMYALLVLAGTYSLCLHKIAGQNPQNTGQSSAGMFVQFMARNPLAIIPYLI